MRFCEKLKNLRKFSGYGFNEFWKTAKISNVYLSGLENGTKLPPPPERQQEFIMIFNKRKTLDLADINEFYDLAALERNEVPADILMFCKKTDSLKKIREFIKENRDEK